MSGSSDNTIRLWDIECGACLRTLEGHEELVRCIRWGDRLADLSGMSSCICHRITVMYSRFDSKRIVSGAYDGKIKVWDLQAAMDPRSA